MGFFFSKKEEKVLEKITAMYIDDGGNEWIAEYQYEDILLQPSFNRVKLNTNQKVDIVLANTSNDMNAIDSVEVLVNNILIGYISSVGQRRMIRDFMTKEERLVLAQVSQISFFEKKLRICYYKSKKYLDEQKVKYEAEKAAYKSLPPLTFETSLISNKSAQMQYEISQASVGKKIECYEEDERKYLVETKDSWMLGYVPKKIANKLDELINNDVYDIVDGEILEIFTEDEKLNVKVRLVLEDVTYR